MTTPIPIRPANSHPPRRFYSDGRAIWYIDRLWALAADLPAFDLPVESAVNLDEVGWFSEAWGVRPTYRAVIDHCRRILAADLAFPIILAPPVPPHNGCVLDGIHRLARAALDGRPTLRAVRLPAMPPPDEVLAATDPRYRADPPG